MGLKFMKKIILCISIFILSASIAEAKSEQQKIYHVPSAQIAKYVEDTKGQKRVLMIYTSWCPYCRKKMPGLIGLAQKNPKSVIAVSVDENYSNFKDFIKRHKDAPFKFILNKGKESALQGALKPYIITPWTGYPTIVLISAQNKPVGQNNYSIEEIENFLSE